MHIADIVSRATQGSNRGRVAELLVAADLSASGFIVSFPSADSPFDLIASAGKKDFRVQVKCAYERKDRPGSWVVHTRRTIGRRREPWEYQLEDFDYYGIVVPDEGIYYPPHNGLWKSHQTITDEVRVHREIPHGAQG